MFNNHHVAVDRSLFLFVIVNNVYTQYASFPLYNQISLFLIEYLIDTTVVGLALSCIYAAPFYILSTAVITHHSSSLSFKGLKIPLLSFYSKSIHKIRLIDNKNMSKLGDIVTKRSIFPHRKLITNIIFDILISRLIVRKNVNVIINYILLSVDDK